MIWIDRDEEMPPEGMQILVFSPEYAEGQPMRFRIMDSQFYRLATDATHWATLETPQLQ